MCSLPFCQTSTEKLLGSDDKMDEEDGSTTEAIRAFGETTWSAFDWSSLPELENYFKSEMSQGEELEPARLTHLRLSDEFTLNRSEFTSLGYLTDVTHLECVLEPQIIGEETDGDVVSGVIEGDKVTSEEKPPLLPHQQQFLSRLKSLTLTVSQSTRTSVKSTHDNVHALNDITYIMRECLGLQEAQIWIQQVFTWKYKRRV